MINKNGTKLQQTAHIMTLKDMRNNMTRYMRDIYAQLKGVTNVVQRKNDVTIYINTPRTQ